MNPVCVTGEQVKLSLAWMLANGAVLPETPNLILPAPVTFQSQDANLLCIVNLVAPEAGVFARSVGPVGSCKVVCMGYGAPAGGAPRPGAVAQLAEVTIDVVPRPALGINVGRSQPVV